MSTPTIDYDALAAQTGGTAQAAPVDYDALAAQHGGTAADARQPSYGDALFNPVGSGAHSQGIIGGLEQLGGRAMQNITAPILHPLETLTGIGKTLAAGVPGGNTLVPDDSMSQRVQEFSDEWKKSPALALENAAGDAIGAIEGGRIGGAAINKAQQVAGPVVSRAVLLGKTPAEAYESALKPSTTLPQAQRAAIVQTGLREGIPVSKGGLQTVGQRIDQLNRAIEDEIAQNPTKPIDPQAVAARANDVIPRFANQVNAGGDLAAIQASKQQFLTEQGARPGFTPLNAFDAEGNPIAGAAEPPQPAPPMNASDAQAMKQGTYRVLAGKFGEQGSATVEAQKALARGLKEEIANQFPEIGKMNARESQLLDLQPALERAVGRISNHQLIGIGTPVASAAAKAVTGSGSVGIVAGVLKSVLDDPMVKSRLAISLSKGAGIPYAQAAARVGAYSTALGSTVASARASQPDQTGNE